METQALPLQPQLLCSNTSCVPHEAAGVAVSFGEYQVYAWQSEATFSELIEEQILKKDHFYLIIFTLCALKLALL